MVAPGEVTVVGLGPGRPGLMTSEALAAIAATPVRWLRTSRHPSAGAVPGARSFDYLYESAASMEEVYAGIVDALAASAARPRAHHLRRPGLSRGGRAQRRAAEGRPPGEDRRVAGRLVCRPGFFPPRGRPSGRRGPPGGRAPLRRRSRRVTRPVAGGPVRLARRAVGGEAGHRLRARPAGPGARPTGSPGPARSFEVTVLQHLGLPDESVRRVAWDDLDRDVEAGPPDQPVAARPGRPVRLRTGTPGGAGPGAAGRCPWDREQTHQSLTRYLLEESYEALEAIEELGPDGAGYEHLEEELGDVLFQVVFHSVLAAEQGQFALGDVARNVHDKLVGRHPHVFGDVVAKTPDDVVRNWELIKKQEKGRASVMDGVPRNLPALLYAHKIQRKAASVGFDWQDARGALDKVGEELAELSEALACAPVAGATDASAGMGAVRDELGDLLFAAVNVARHVKVDPEAALREATAKFRRRFQAVEALAAERGLDLPGTGLAQLDLLWDEVKAAATGP